MRFSRPGHTPPAGDTGPMLRPSRCPHHCHSARGTALSRTTWTRALSQRSRCVAEEYRRLYLQQMVCRDTVVIYEEETQRTPEYVEGGRHSGATSAQTLWLDESTCRRVIRHWLAETKRVGVRGPPFASTLICFTLTTVAVHSHQGQKSWYICLHATSELGVPGRSLRVPVFRAFRGAQTHEWP